MKKLLSLVLLSILLATTLIACSSKDDNNLDSQSQPVEQENQDVAKEGEVEEVSEGVSGFSEEDVEEAKSFLENIERAKNLDYEEVASNALAKAQELSPNDRELRKWIIRLYIYAEISGEGISEDLLDDAKAAKERREGWFKYVQNEYGISVTDKEVDEYIKKQVKNTDNTVDIAKGLGMSVEYLNYTYERDQYTQQVMWEKLLPELYDKYPPEEEESDDAYFVRVNNEFNKELDKYLGVTE